MCLNHNISRYYNGVTEGNHLIDYVHISLYISLPPSAQCPVFPRSTRHSGHTNFNPYPTAFPYGNGMVLHFYKQQESSTTKTVYKVINKGLKAYV